MPGSFQKIRSFRAIFIVFLISGCAAQGLLKENELAYISKVQVSKAKPVFGTVNLAEAIRVRTLRQARRYPRAGRAKLMKIRVTGIHFKNALMSVIAGDSNRMQATVSIIDAGTGKTDGTYTVSAIDSFVLQGVAGALLTGLDTPIKAEQRMAEDLAKNAMNGFYGSNSPVAAGPPGALPRANYPASYAALERKYACEKARSTSHDPNDVMAEQKQPKVRC